MFLFQRSYSQKLADQGRLGSKTSNRTMQKQSVAQQKQRQESIISNCEHKIDIFDCQQDDCYDYGIQHDKKIIFAGLKEEDYLRMLFSKEQIILNLKSLLLKSFAFVGQVFEENFLLIFEKIKKLQEKMEILSSKYTEEIAKYRQIIISLKKKRNQAQRYEKSKDLVKVLNEKEKIQSSRDCNKDLKEPLLECFHTTLEIQKTQRILHQRFCIKNNFQDLKGLKIKEDLQQINSFRHDLFSLRHKYQNLVQDNYRLHQEIAYYKRELFKEIKEKIILSQKISHLSTQITFNPAYTKQFRTCDDHIQKEKVIREKNEKNREMSKLRGYVKTNNVQMDSMIAEKSKDPVKIKSWHFQNGVI